MVLVKRVSQVRLVWRKWTSPGIASLIWWALPVHLVSAACAQPLVLLLTVLLLGAVVVTSADQTHNPRGPMIHQFGHTIAHRSDGS